MIFIPGNVPALKNSKQITSMGPRCHVCKRGRYSGLTASKAVKLWKKESARYWKQYKHQFLSEIKLTDKPIRIQFTFVRKSRHRFDYTNAIDTVQDEMVTHGWIEDDNSDELIPVVGRYRYNKENPGVWIKVLL